MKSKVFNIVVTRDVLEGIDYYKTHKDDNSVYGSCFYSKTDFDDYYELGKTLFATSDITCWDCGTWYNFRELLHIPADYQVHIIFKPSVTDEQILKVCEVNNYLNPSSNVTISMVR